MKTIRFILIVAALILLPLFIATRGPAAVEPVVAAPEGASPVLCQRVYLPAIISGVSAGETAVADSGIITPPNTPSPNAECDGFPDFNGDGYADLVIGAPRKGNFDTGIVQVVYGSGTGLNAGDGAVIDDQVWHRQLGGVAAETNDYYGTAVAMGDFNRDGYDDLAVGIPGAEIDGQAGAGAVQVIYGSAAGLTNADIQEWSQANSTPLGDAQVDANFGAALAAGDFDGDGYTDLAIGVPQAMVDSVNDAGGVQILYGYDFGLGAFGSEWITQNTPGYTASSAQSDDQFGFTLAAGDFNGDDVDDLAVGTPYEDNDGGFTDAGAVQILYGEADDSEVLSGLIALGSVNNAQEWRSGLANVHGAHEENDRFGWSLAVGDFDGDSYDDLAVGIPHETHGSGAGALVFGGAVNVIMGSANGLEATSDKPARLWHQDQTDMNGAVGAFDRFGWSLAAADYDNDGYADLAIGIPVDDHVLNPAGLADIGAVQIVFGTADGLAAVNNTLRYHAGQPEAGDYFGGTLFAADFNGDGTSDLAVGAPFDTPAELAETFVGTVFTFDSSTTSGPLQTENQNWYPGFNGLQGTAAGSDYFGEALPGSPRR